MRFSSLFCFLLFDSKMNTRRSFRMYNSWAWVGWEATGHPRARVSRVKCPAQQSWHRKNPLRTLSISFHRSHYDLIKSNNFHQITAMHHKPMPAMLCRAGDQRCLTTHLWGDWVSPDASMPQQPPSRHQGDIFRVRGLERVVCWHPIFLKD